MEWAYHRAVPHPYLTMPDRATGWCVTGRYLDPAIVGHISMPESGELAWPH
ncbi:MAG: hypothetical protein ACFFC7_15740 [Candidatus Hermodarchaeota archaeon]